MSEWVTLAEGEIDQALRLVGGVEPRFGFERRLLAQLAAASASVPASGRGLEGLWPLRRGMKIGGLLLAASIAGVALLLGNATPKTSVRPSTVQQSPASRGFGAASAGQVPSRSLDSSRDGRRSRSRGRARQGRAILHSSPRGRAHGTAAPDSPYVHPE